MKRIKVTRRGFLKGSAFITGSAAGAGLYVGHNPELEAAVAAPAAAKRTTALAQCPYCGVGCGTIIQAENGKIVSMRPDKDHPTNFGLQCIKGLTAAEPIYVDRMEGDCYVRKDVWAEWSKPGHGDLAFVTRTKGSFDEEHFVRVPYEQASEMTAHKIAHFAKENGGNSIALYGSGQLTTEGQYLENLFMKGVLGSNTIEANARMCMTSAVTGYFATLGSDTPPLAYEDIELCDMIMHFGHNARESHPIIFWRAADYKKKKDIPTVVVDPRYTGTSQGYADINPDNQVHVPILNGDISFLNAMAHVLLKEHPDVIDWDFVKKHATGWKEYTDGVLASYSPEQVQDRMGSAEVTPALIRRVAGMFADATRKRLARSKQSQAGAEVGVPGGGGYGGVIIMWGIGYNQHIHGQYNVISIINLLALTGNLAKPGCGPFSMTGQPNAMGERFTGGLTGRLPFNEPLSNLEHLIKMAGHWRVPEKNLKNALNSKNPGYAVGMMERALKGEVKVMFLVYATHIDLPDQQNLVRPALTKTFTVVQEIYRHAPNNLYADVIFPAATWGEVTGIYISSERRLNICDKAAEPPPGCRPDMDMVEFGTREGVYTIDNIPLLEEARDKGLTPDLPDDAHRGKKWDQVPKDKFPYWLGLGVVYEHFHTAKSNRSPTTRRLVPEMYVEMHPEDAEALGVKDGEKVRLVTRRGSYEGRAQVGTNSLVKPARNSVPRGYLFSPWNLSVADSADPRKNKWLVNSTSSRVWDPVSGQVDFKKLACRVEKV
jgi:nitrate reductase NapA